MRRVILFFLSVFMLLMASVASAQPLRIHGTAEQRAIAGLPEFYVSAEQWSKDQGQCHWNTDPHADQAIIDRTHIHIQPIIPKYAELSGPIDVRVKYTLHKFAGSLQWLGATTQWLCCSTAASQAPIVMDQPGPYRGDPNGDVVYWGTVTIDPTTPRNVVDANGVPLPNIAKGWFAAAFSGSLYFDNGDAVNAAFRQPLYSIVDPNAPEPGDGVGPFGDQLFRAHPSTDMQCSPFSARFDTSWGTAVIGVGAFNDGLIPDAAFPLDHTWSTSVLQPERGMMFGASGYGSGTALPPATLEVRLDPDFHHGVEGTTVISQVEAPQGTNIHFPLVFDPAAMTTPQPMELLGTKTHRYVGMWTQRDFDRFAPDGTKIDDHDIASALIVLDVTPGDGVTPPVVTPPPPPPPPPSWQLIQPQFFRLGDQLKVCDGDKCILLGTVKP